MRAYLELPRWGVTFRKAQHEGLIALATFEKIQDLLRSGAKTPARKDISSDFPLRGLVVCSDCETPLTACWSTSKTGDKHPYYLCPKKGCASYRKSIRRTELERDFENLIAGVTPDPQTFERLVEELDAFTKGAAAESEDVRVEIRTRLTEIDTQIETLLGRLMEGKSEPLVASYERRVEKLEREKLLLNERLGAHAKPCQRPSQEFEPVLGFLKNPMNLWPSDDLARKQALMKMLFAARPGYKKKIGVRTPIYACPVNALTAISDGKSEMAHPKRFELLTPRFVVWCSIQLSYGCLVGLCIFLSGPRT